MNNVYSSIIYLIIATIHNRSFSCNDKRKLSLFTFLFLGGLGLGVGWMLPLSLLPYICFMNYPKCWVIPEKQIFSVMTLLVFQSYHVRLTVNIERFINGVGRIQHPVLVLSYEALRLNIDLLSSKSIGIVICDEVGLKINLFCS